MCPILRDTGAQTVRHRVWRRFYLEPRDSRTSTVALRCRIFGWTKFPGESKLGARDRVALITKMTFHLLSARRARRKSRDVVVGVWVWPDGGSPRIDRDPGRFLRGRSNDHTDAPSVHARTRTNTRINNSTSCSVVELSRET